MPGLFYAEIDDCCLKYAKGRDCFDIESVAENDMLLGHRKTGTQLDGEHLEILNPPLAFAIRWSCIESISETIQTFIPDEMNEDLWSEAELDKAIAAFQEVTRTKIVPFPAGGAAE